MGNMADDGSTELRAFRNRVQPADPVPPPAGMAGMPQPTMSPLPANRGMSRAKMTLLMLVLLVVNDALLVVIGTTIVEDIYKVSPEVGGGLSAPQLNVDGLVSDAVSSEGELTLASAN